MTCNVCLHNPADEEDGEESASSWSESRWYRVRVLDVEDDGGEDGCLVQLFYLDIGCIRWLRERHLRYIEPAFVHIPPLVRHCAYSCFPDYMGCRYGQPMYS